MTQALLHKWCAGLRSHAALPLTGETGCGQSLAGHPAFQGSTSLNCCGIRFYTDFLIRTWTPVAQLQALRRFEYLLVSAKSDDGTLLKCCEFGLAGSGITR